MGNKTNQNQQRKDKGAGAQGGNGADTGTQEQDLKKEMPQGGQPQITTTEVGGGAAPGSDQGDKPQLDGESEGDSQLPEEKEIKSAANVFVDALKVAEKDPMDKLHLNNLVTVLDELLAIKKAGLCKSDYEIAAGQLSSLIRSMSTVSDKVFVQAFPAFLDTIEQHMGNEELLLVDKTNVFKIFTNTAGTNPLSREHVQFVTAVLALAPTKTRRQEVNQIDIPFNFSSLPDTKRIRIKEIWRS